MTVIHGDFPLIIGKAYHDEIAGPDMKYHLVSYIVMGEASLQDLKDYIKEMGCEDTGEYGKYVYFVQMD